MARTMEHYTLTWAFHDVAPESLKPGDHVYKWSSPMHAYHGIVVETEPATEPGITGVSNPADHITVLHLPCSCCGNLMRAQRESLRLFEARAQKMRIGGGLKVARYGVSGLETWVKRYGTCYSVECDPVEQVLRRAETLVHEDTLERVKCEHLAFWCKTGIWQPRQIVGTRRAVMCSLGAAVCASMRLHPTAGIVALAGGGLLRQLASHPETGPEAPAERFREEPPEASSPQDEPSNSTLQADSQCTHHPADHVVAPVFSGKPESEMSRSSLTEDLPHDPDLDDFVVLDAPADAR